LILFFQQLAIHISLALIIFWSVIQKLRLLAEVCVSDNLQEMVQNNSNIVYKGESEDIDIKTT